MSAPAVPSSDGSDAGNGTIEDSVSANPGVVSGLQAPAAQTTAETVPHTGQSNNVDPYLYEQFLSVSTVTWNTTMLPGTLIFKAPIHPTSSNNIVSYMSKLYNTWSGSIQFKIKVAGTGFHAGALIMARIPPNIDPDSLTEMSSITAFEWELIDPKQLELVTRQVMDQRPVMYHYKNLDVTNPNSFGGWYCLYVLMPLNTSSTGLSQINVQIFSRLGNDFCFSQIVPPILDKTITSANPYNALFPPGYGAVEPYLSQPVSYIRVEVPTPLITKGQYGAVKLNREEAQSFEYLPAQNSYLTNESFGFLTTWDKQLRKVPMSMPAITYDWDTSMTDNPFIDMSAPLNLGKNSNVTPFLCLFRPTLRPLEIHSDGANNQKTVYNGESPVYFEADIEVSGIGGTPSDPPVLHHVTWNSVQTVAMRNALLNIIPANQVQNQCIRYVVSERDTGLPIMYLKLYPAGFFTTSPSSTVLRLTYNRYDIRQDGVMQITDVLPNPVDMRRNRMLLKVTKSL